MYISRCSYNVDSQPGWSIPTNTVHIELEDVRDSQLSYILALARYKRSVRVGEVFSDASESEKYAESDVAATKALYDYWHLGNGLKVVKVIYNKPATIVFWNDGTKTVVKCGKGDKYDPQKGFYVACTKKLFGNNYAAVGRMNKALELAVDVSKKEK